MPDEPPQKPPGKRRAKERASPEAVPGRLASDDRGNMTWQWANDEVLQADDTAGAIERLRALVDPRLGIIDDGAPGSSPKSPVAGYNPYDSGALARTERRRKKKMSLQELSKWIEAKRKLESGQESDE